MGYYSPMPSKYHILHDPELLKGEDINKYQSIIGSLQYFAGITRYDISYPVARLAQYCSNPTVGSMKGVNKILSYFKVMG